ncbi:unnamed protein product [Gemmataceae bacterium]|nr:unnamed protein product [Gemmataceae bacterium]VTU01375.1 unnamed protein product [Gemmataceae bacterium]
MLTRFAAVCAGLVVAVAAPAADDDWAIHVIETKLFAVETVTLTETPKDGKAKTHTVTAFGKPSFVAGTGPYEVFVKPKGGIPVRVADRLTVRAGATHELKVGDLLGSVEVFGDNFPRAAKVVLTDVKDDGPGEKGHVAVQEAKEYRVEMAAPPGTYAVWVVPDNGAKAQRVVDNVRVQAGRSTRVGD